VVEQIIAGSLVEKKWFANIMDTGEPEQSGFWPMKNYIRR